MTIHSSDWNVVLSSAGRRAYLVDYFKAALGKSGKVITTNATADATAMIHADIACVIPHAGDGASWMPWLTFAKHIQPNFCFRCMIGKPRLSRLIVTDF